MVPPENNDGDWNEWRNAILQSLSRHEEELKAINGRIDTMKNAIIGGLVAILAEAIFLWISWKK